MIAYGCLFTFHSPISTRRPGKPNRDQGKTSKIYSFVGGKSCSVEEKFNSNNELTLLFRVIFKVLKMDLLMSMPDDIFKYQLMQFLTIYDLASFDTACTSYFHRNEYLEKIREVILIGNNKSCLSLHILPWLNERKIYLQNLFIAYEEIYLDRLRYSMRLLKKNNEKKLKLILPSMKLCTGLTVSNSFVLDAYLVDQEAQHIVLSNHYCCPLRSLKVLYNWITDSTIISIATYCTGLRSLSLQKCFRLKDASVSLLTKTCHRLQWLNISQCRNLTDISIISLSLYCTQLVVLDVSGIPLTDDSILSISTHCSKLQIINFSECRKLTDISIISISTYCKELQSLDLSSCEKISDTCIIYISTHSLMLRSLDVSFCINLTDHGILTMIRTSINLQSLAIQGCSGISDATIVLLLSTHCNNLQALWRFSFCAEVNDDECTRSLKLKYTRVRRQENNSPITTTFFNTSSF